MLYEAEIERYIGTLKGKKPGEPAGDSLKKKTRSALSEFMNILDRSGRVWPEESDYVEYLSGKAKTKETEQNQTRIEKFFMWLDKEQDNMSENEVKTEKSVQVEMFGAGEENTQSASVDAGAVAENEPESMAEAEQPKKKEKKVPVSVYLDAETHRVLKSLSVIRSETLSEIIADTVSKFAKKNAARIEAKAVKVNEILEAAKKEMESFTLEY